MSLHTRALLNQARMSKHPGTAVGIFLKGKGALRRGLKVYKRDTGINRYLQQEADRRLRIKKLGIGALAAAGLGGAVGYRSRKKR